MVTTSDARYRTTDKNPPNFAISSVSGTPRRNDVIGPRICDELTEVLMHVTQRHRDVRVHLHLSSVEVALTCPQVWYHSLC